MTSPELQSRSPSRSWVPPGLIAAYCTAFPSIDILVEETPSGSSASTVRKTASDWQVGDPPKMLYVQRPISHPLLLSVLMMLRKRREYPVNTLKVGFGGAEM